MATTTKKDAKKAGKKLGAKSSTKTQKSAAASDLAKAARPGGDTSKKDAKKAARKLATKSSTKAQKSAAASDPLGLPGGGRLGRDVQRHRRGGRRLPQRVDLCPGRDVGVERHQSPFRVGNRSTSTLPAPESRRCLSHVPVAARHPGGCSCRASLRPDRSHPVAAPGARRLDHKPTPTRAAGVGGLVGGVIGVRASQHFFLGEGLVLVLFLFAVGLICGYLADHFRGPGCGAWAAHRPATTAPLARYSAVHPDSGQKRPRTQS